MNFLFSFFNWMIILSLSIHIHKTALIFTGTNIHHYIELNGNIFVKIHTYCKMISEFSEPFERNIAKLWKLSWYLIFVSYSATWILFPIVTEYQNPYFFEVPIMMKRRNMTLFLKYIRSNSQLQVMQIQTISDFFGSILK